MAQFRRFNASNKDHTCIWCGRQLRRQPKTALQTVEKTITHYPHKIRNNFGYDETDLTRPEEKISRTQELVPVVPSQFTYGDYEDGFFCGLRCGYDFAKAAANNGYRLKPILDQEQQRKA